MKNLLNILAALVLGLLCGCSKEKLPEKNDREITIVPVVDNIESSTKASLYYSEPELRGDMFNVQAYLHGTPNKFFNSNMFYYAQTLEVVDRKWYFEGFNKFYWPLEDALDFFASTPTSIPSEDSSPYMINVDHSTNPPTFTAKLPLLYDEPEGQEGGNNVVPVDETLRQDNMKEFMYTYVQKKYKSTEVLTLSFWHPFSAIIFKVSQSQRDLTVNKITIGDIQYKGKCSFSEADPDNPVWTSEGIDSPTDDLVLNINKIIPGQVNFGGDLCDYCLVLPQINEGTPKSFSIECHWDGYDTDPSDDVDETVKTFTGSITNNWEPSKIYTYTLDLGNSREEILFKVTVDPWHYVYEHEFEIE